MINVNVKLNLYELSSKYINNGHSTLNQEGTRYKERNVSVGSDERLCVS